MQTFLPYPDIAESAKVLDRRRLGKQRVEAYQIYLTLDGQSHGWKNHPAVKMWRGYRTSLAVYGFAVCVEWSGRGYTDNLEIKFQEFLSDHHIDECGRPPWFGNEDFHASHRSNLLRKDFSWYSRFGWSEPDNLPYIWPV